MKSVLPEYMISISICCIPAGPPHLCWHGRHMGQWTFSEWKLISVLHSVIGLHRTQDSTAVQGMGNRELGKGCLRRCFTKGTWFERHIFPWPWTFLPEGRLRWGLGKNVNHPSQGDWLREIAEGPGDSLLKRNRNELSRSDQKRMTKWN